MLRWVRPFADLSTIDIHTVRRRRWERGGNHQRSVVHSVAQRRSPVSRPTCGNSNMAW